MLVNFTTGDEAWNVKPVFKGGRWRDRLHARHTLRKSRGELNNTGVTGSGKEADSGEANEPPTKRQKTLRVATNSAAKAQRDQPGEIISSLFSYNPEPTTTSKRDVQENEIPAKPSNAPLPGGAENFTSLGLVPPLASYLLTKLELKAPTAIQKIAISRLLQEDSDAFIQAETGSGKTLAYLLPIMQRLMKMSSTLKEMNDDQVKLIHRDSGLFAIIIAPTRELCKQISVVLDSLLGCARWVVSGTVFGGEKKKSEKARLRKGLNILVATPGRLVDHLEHTKALDVSNVRWLVLDEGDRLMELGFEDDIRTIVKTLEQRSKSQQNPIPGLPPQKTTILCSATMKMNVQRLGEMSLKDALHIKNDVPVSTNESTNNPSGSPEFSAPAQLQQSYIIVPPKQRLVTLFALLKRTFARKGSVSKAIVFLSCADSVDFHFLILSRSNSSSFRSPSRSLSPSPSLSLESLPPPPDSSPAPPSFPSQDKSQTPLPTTSPSPLLTTSANSGITLFKLHGSLTQPLRTATLASFSRSPNPSILLTTDLSSRGLDLPSIDLVVEYDPAFSAEDHLHRIGRTARAGREGRATIFLMPGKEEGYVAVLRKSFKDPTTGRLRRWDAEEVLKRGFIPEEIPTAASSFASNGRLKSNGKQAGKVKKDSGETWEDQATEWQLEAERWVTGSLRHAEMARKAYVSHVRAYATHIVPERHIFDVKDLHLGHLAKGFGLRERPGNMGRGGSGKGGVRDKGKRRLEKSEKGTGGRKRDVDDSDVKMARSSGVDRSEAERKMRKAMKGYTGASEFNIG